MIKYKRITSAEEAVFVKGKTMKRLCSFLVDRRRAVFCVMMALVLVNLFLIPRVKVNTDLVRYLPDSSRMKQGIDILAEEFSDLSMSSSNTVRVMFKDVPDNEKDGIFEEMKQTPNAGSVAFRKNDPHYEKDGYTLYILSFSCGFFSPEMREAENYIKEAFSGRYDMKYNLDKTTQPGVPIGIVAFALCLLILILILFSPSYVEPFLFLFAIGAAVVLNTGSDVFLPGVAEVTFSVGAILQVALSIDYSIILMGRYRQELAREPDKEKAMKQALSGAFSSISGSSLTTVVGLLVLGFMSFKIGFDIGFVMAKGVFLSMVCTFTVLPFLLLIFDGTIKKTAKKVPSLKMDAFGDFFFRHGRAVTAVFAVFFAAMLILKGNTGISFSLIPPNEIDLVFPKENQIVVLYENGDEESVSGMIPEIEAESGVNSVLAWPNTFGKAFAEDELLEMMNGFDMGFSVPPIAVRMIYSSYFKGERGGKLTVRELVNFVHDTFSADSAWGKLLGDDLREMIDKAPEMLDEGEKALKGPEHSLMMISTDLPQESEETTVFMGRLTALCEENLSGNYYLIGNTPMAQEMVATFSDELNFLTFMTAAAIFAVVLLTFRSLAVPVILILLIQSAVYATMVIMNLQGMSVYYLALLVVQSILMGATIDYAIVFTNYYREFRMTMPVREALINAYNDSIHTILTSGLIIVAAVGAVGFAFSDPAVRQIVHTISKGAACSICLILFVLPGLLAAFDFLVVPKGRRYSG